MRTPDGEIVPPGAFIPPAERFGLISAIDRWVIAHAMEIAAEHARDGRDVAFEVNLSAASFGDPELSEFIESELRTSGAPPESLIFEITETAAIANLDDARDFARRLTSLGCLFALDDFGAGFGSFYYLKYLPLDYLKIDGDFIQDLAGSFSDQLMVKAMVQVAHGLGLKTIAEFVGDDDTLAFLRRYGVDFAQGYHVGRPGPLAEVLGGAASATS
jgi:EAL domain-containing protein (putative c-di-GMP-specific phosphodiesterase class I)